MHSWDYWLICRWSINRQRSVAFTGMWVAPPPTTTIGGNVSIASCGWFGPGSRGFAGSHVKPPATYVVFLQCFFRHDREWDCDSTSRGNFSTLVCWNFVCHIFAHKKDHSWIILIFILLLTYINPPTRPGKIMRDLEIQHKWHENLDFDLIYSWVESLSDYLLKIY